MSFFDIFLDLFVSQKLEARGARISQCNAVAAYTAHRAN